MEQNNVILISLLPPPYGGIAQWTKKTLELAPKYNVNYVLVDESNSNERKHFGDNTKRSILSDIKRALRIRKDLKSALVNTDNSYVVHCCVPSLKYSMMRELSNLRLIKKYKRKYIIHFRSTVSNNVKTKKQKRLLKKLLIKADKIILLNTQSYDFCYKLFPNDKMVVLPNYIDANETDSHHVINNDIKNILYVGMITPEKGVDDIVDVAHFFPNISFNLIGRVSEEITKYCGDKEIKNLHFLGTMDKQKILNYYKEADLFLFLSRFSSEGFSNSLCEAMGMGLPCIVTDWAANKDMIGDRIPQAIVESRNTKQLKESIMFFYNKNNRLVASRSNYEKVINCYIDDVVIKGLKDIYNSLK